MSGAGRGAAWREGYAILEERLAAVPALLQRALCEASVAAPWPEGGAFRQVVATGVGTSAAHARFLVSVLQEADVPARFAPLSAFLAPPAAGAAEDLLVVFSQGVSPNARIALAHSQAWRAACLVTAASESDAPAAGKWGDRDLHDLPCAALGERRAALAGLRAAGVRIVGCAGGEEYGTLVRVRGALLGYAAALGFAAALLRAGGREPAWTRVDPAEVSGRVAGARARLDCELVDLDASALRRGLALLASGVHLERIENLRRLVLEGMLLAAPPLWDLLDLAHGPFQQAFSGRATLVALARADAPGEPELLERLAAMLEPARHRLFCVTTHLPGALAIFEHEALFAALVLRFLAARHVDQVRWPGRGADASLYAVGPEIVERCGRAPSPDAAPVPQVLPSGLPAGVLEDLTWPEVDRRLASGCRTALLPLGSTEQHGPHLVLAADTRIAADLARRLCARRREAIALAALALGCAAEHLAFPGTLSLREATLRAVLCDVARSLARHGFRRLVIFSAHGGNRRALEGAPADLRAAAAELEVLVLPGPESPTVSRALLGEAGRLGVSPRAAGQHAGELETSILLGIAPWAVRTRGLEAGLIETDLDSERLFYPDLRANARDGTVGDPRPASARHAEAYLEVWVETLLAEWGEAERRAGDSSKHTKGR